MALNQIERAMLVAARQYLVDKRSDRICYAIGSAEQFMHDTIPHCRREVLQKAGSRLKTFIMNAIEQEYGLEDWVAGRLPGCGAQTNGERMRATRIAWIDWLLDEPWTDHNGGHCPLLPDEKVIVRLRNGEERGHNGARLASHGRWDHWHNAKAPLLDGGGQYDTVAYKVIYEPPTEPGPAIEFVPVKGGFDVHF